MAERRVRVDGAKASGQGPLHLPRSGDGSRPHGLAPRSHNQVKDEPHDRPTSTMKTLVNSRARITVESAPFEDDEMSDFDADPLVPDDETAGASKSKAKNKKLGVSGAAKGKMKEEAVSPVRKKSRASYGSGSGLVRDNMDASRNHALGSSRVAGARSDSPIEVGNSQEETDAEEQGGVSQIHEEDSIHFAQFKFRASHAPKEKKVQRKAATHGSDADDDLEDDGVEMSMGDVAPGRGRNARASSSSSTSINNSRHQASKASKLKGRNLPPLDPYGQDHEEEDPEEEEEEDEKPDIKPKIWGDIGSEDEVHPTMYGQKRKAKGRPKKKGPELRPDRPKPIPRILEVYFYYAAIEAGRRPDLQFEEAALLSLPPGRKLPGADPRVAIRNGKLCKLSEVKQAEHSMDVDDQTEDEEAGDGDTRAEVDLKPPVKVEGKPVVPKFEVVDSDSDRTISDSELVDVKSDVKPNIKSGEPDVKPDINGVNLRPVDDGGPMDIFDDDATTEEEDVSSISYGTAGIGQASNSEDVEIITRWRSREGVSSDESDAKEAMKSLPKRPANMKESSAWNAQVQKFTKGRDKVAEDQACELQMKPHFPCPAIRHFKKPYPLDPIDKTKVIPKAINRFLRRYQRVGVQFLYDRWKGVKMPGGRGVIHGGVLADDMGLGKTVQVIAFLSAIMEKTGTRTDLEPHRSRKARVRDKTRRGETVTPMTFGPTCLIACPGTLIDNWQRELQTWGNFDFEIYTGTRSRREEILLKYSQGFLDLLLMSVDSVRADAKLLMDVKFSVIIADEAHQLKTENALKTIAFKNLLADARFALTGTLMQNRYDEMWSVLDFTSPGQLGTMSMWHQYITLPLLNGTTRNAHRAEIGLAATRSQDLANYILGMYSLRRTKALVAGELPKKTDQVVFCPLTPIQELVYDRVSQSPLVQWYLHRADPCPECPGGPELQSCCMPSPFDDEDGEKEFVLAYISIFRKISSHIAQVFPHATDKVEQKETASALLDVCFPRPPAGAIIPRYSMQANDLVYRKLTANMADLRQEFSGKWMVLREMLRTWRADRQAQHRVLLFSESVRMLKIIETFILQENYSSEFLHGEVKQEDRQFMVDRFQRGEIFVFLISTITGGAGLNLTAGNKVVIFDVSWNPANDLQAMDRAFRMGQKRDVDVYRLVARGTIEECIYERQLKKTSAMRIAYNASVEARLTKGHEHMTDDSDLYGAKNLFTYHRDGTSLQREARLLSEEEDIQMQMDAVNGTAAQGDAALIKRASVLKIMTDEQAGEEIEESNSEERDKQDIMTAIAEAVPGVIHQTITHASKASEVERLIVAEARDATGKGRVRYDRISATDHYLLGDNVKSLEAQRRKIAAQGTAKHGGKTSPRKVSAAVAIASYLIAKPAPSLAGNKKRGLIDDDDD